MDDPLAYRMHVPENVFLRQVAGEAVILNLDTGQYYGLDAVGLRMWQVMVETKSLRDARDRLHDEYEVSEERLTADLLQLVDLLVENGLVEKLPGA